MVTKLNSNFDDSKTQTVKKTTKMLQNSNCDKTQIVTKLKLWQDSKTGMLQNSNWDKTQKLNCEKTQKLNMWQNSKTKKGTKLKLGQNSKTQILTIVELWKKFVYEKREKKVRVFKSEHFDTLTTDEMFSGQRFAIFAMFYKFPPSFPGSETNKHWY